MDTLSHGLWSGIAFGRKNRRGFWWSFLFGVLPDIISFGVYFIAVWVGLNPAPDWRIEPPQDDFIPRYIHTLYALTHSFIIFIAIFLLLLFLFRRPIYEFFAWGLHILMDIPTHSYEFFPTPFLWPLSGYRFNGIPWSHAAIMLPNIILLITLYAYFFLLRPYLRKRKQPRQS